MNLRILKKLSKRAAPLLPILGDCREQFPAAKDENYHSTAGHDRKHWHRMRAKYPCDFLGEIKYRPRDGQDWIVMREPYHPRKGTPMVGAVVGYYEPEWEEETAWDALRRVVYDNFTDWSEDGWTVLRDLSTPSLILRAAEELCATKQGEPK